MNVAVYLHHSIFIYCKNTIQYITEGTRKWMALRSSSTLGIVHNNSTSSTNVKVKISEYKKINKNSKATIHSTSPLCHLCFCSTCPHQRGIQARRLVVYSGRCCDVCLPACLVMKRMMCDQTRLSVSYSYLTQYQQQHPSFTYATIQRVECE